MKHFKLSLLLTVLMSMVSMGAWADGFKVGNLYYNIVSASDKTVEVVKPDIGASFQDNIIVPSTISYEGIPFTVVGIGASAFPNISSIVLPNTIEYFGEEAFAGANFSSIEIPNSVKTIGPGAFRFCFSLSTIVIPNSVTEIGEMTFWNCTKLESVVLSENLTYLPYWMFRDCSQLTSITIPDNITDIEQETFYGCQNLASVVLPKRLKRMEADIFAGCDKIRNITSRSSLIGCDFNIDKNAFSGTVQMFASVKVPEGSIARYQDIGWGDFSNIEEDSSLPVQCIIDVSTNYIDTGNLATFQFFGNVKVNDYTVQWIDWENSNFWDYSCDPILVDKGNTPVLTFIPYTTNTEIVKVTVNGIDVTDKIQNNTYTMDPVTGDCSVYVEFDNGVRTIEANYDTNCGGVFLDGNWVDGHCNDIWMGCGNVYETTKNATVRMTIEPHEGFKIKTVLVGGSDVTTQYLADSYYDISNIPLSGTSVSVQFEEVKWYTVSTNNYDYHHSCHVTVNGHSLDYWDSLRYQEGENVKITVDWGDDVKVTSISLNGTSVASGNNITSPFSYSFNISEDVVINLQVVENPHILAVSYTGDGSVTINGSEVASGTNYEIAMNGMAYVTIQADEGCEIESVLYNGSEQLSDTHDTYYEFRADYGEGSNQTLTVKFRRAQCFIATNIQGNGTVAINGVNLTNGDNTAYDPDQDLTVTFTPGTGWELASANIDGADITSYAQGGTYTIKKINANKTIDVTFVPVSLTFSTYRYMTICSPQGLDFRGVSDVKAWTVTGFDGNKIYLTPVEIVPAGKGVLLEAAVGTTWTPTFTDEKFYMANLLVGTLNPIWLDVYSYNADNYCRNYIFSNGTKGLGFYPLSSAGDFAAGKAYLPIPTYVVEGARGGQFTLDFDGNTNGIDSVNDAGETESIYSISGVRVDTPKKGLYIKNGKKIVVK